MALLVEGARAPVIAGAVATVTTWIPHDTLDDLTDCVAGLDPDAAAAGPPDASGAWSGVLLPMLREASRLLAEIFDAIGRVEPWAAGGYDLTFTVPLPVHDRLALWGASLDRVAHLIPEPVPRPALPLTALEVGVPQEMAVIVLDLYAAETRPPSEPPEIVSAA